MPRERVAETSGNPKHQRVRWWSVLALLRSLASSPAAAAATLRTRSGTVETETEEEADIVGERSVLDLDDVDASETLDIAPGGQEGEEQPEADRNRLLRFAREADRLRGPAHDAKLAAAIAVVRHLLDDGYNPILFCRFIPTAEYVAEELRKAFVGAYPRGRPEVAAVTGILPPADREARVEALGKHRAPCAGGYRLFERGHQPAAALRRRGALRPELEPDPPRTARGPRGPLRPAQAHGAHGHLLRDRQPDRRHRAGRAVAQAPDHPLVAGHLGAGAGQHE